MLNCLWELKPPTFQGKSRRSRGTKGGNMHPRVYREFEQICSERDVGDTVLEIGAIPSDLSLLNMRTLRDVKEKIGINLDGPYRYKDFCIIKGNANAMGFGDSRFDTVVCNAVLEHDKFFWRTLSEIKRVTKRGGLVVVGAPGYTGSGIERGIRFLLMSIPIVRRFIRLYADFLIDSTVTYYTHNEPGDYYRFSPQTFVEVFFEGMYKVDVRPIMLPPRIIGCGVKP